MNSKRKSNSENKNGLTARRGLLGALVAVVVIATAAAWLIIPTSDAEGTEVVVYKTATCGCCKKWVAHMRDNGFEVSVVDVSNTQPTRERLGVPRRLGSCHTAKVGNYWVEGHVPADLVQRLLTEQPDNVRGISAPGMPAGSPGMEGPNPVEYQVVSYGTDGKMTVYATRQGRRSPQ